MSILFPISFWEVGGAVVINTHTYVPCPGDGPPGLPDVYIDVAETPGGTIVVATGNPNEAWCYTQSGPVGSTPPTAGITWGNHEDEECPEFCFVFEIQSCDGAYTIHTTNSNIMNAGNGTFTIIGSEKCWQAAGPPVNLSAPNSVFQITDVVFDEIFSPVGEDGCECCDEIISYTNRWEYTLCPGYEGTPAFPTVVIEIPNPTGTAVRPDTIVYNHLGNDYCYSNPVANCEDIDTGTWFVWAGEPGCEPCVTVYPPVS